MFTNKTVIIVGAGASKEVNLPTGKELKDRISNTLKIELDAMGRLIGSDRIICSALESIIKRNGSDEKYHPPHLRYIFAAEKIRNAMPLSISIDHFIDTHQGDKALELCGKLAIVREILHAERDSLLFFDPINQKPSIDHKSVEKTWLNSFMKLLTENCRISKLEERLSSIIFVVFNYDRCVEHFLFNALQTYYSIDDSRAAALVDRVKIYHPYGTVGDLPWSKKKHVIEFGAEPTPDKLIDLANQIKTFTEGADPNSSAIEEIRAGMAEARIVLFLGFAYHPLNLNLIQASRGAHLIPNTVQYFGTAMDISDRNCDVISSDLTKLGGANQNNITLRNNLTCYKLFSEYWRTLALSWSPRLTGA